MIGFDIGGTKCAVCVGYEADGNLEITAKKAIPTDHSISPYNMIDKLIEIAKELTDNFDVVGISCGGPLNSKDGIIMSPPNLPGWDNIKIVDYIKQKLGCAVYLENDANACAIAEWKYGAGAGCENMVFFTFGTGLGAGLILDGRLYRGASDMAGEAGHIRLCDFGPVGYAKQGSFEGFCSGNGIAQLGVSYATQKLQAGEKTSFCENASELNMITAKKIAECANAGFEDALEVYRTCGKMLGRGLAVIIDILNPQKIVLGSIFERSGHLLKDEMEKVLKKECLPASLNVCEIVPARLGDSIGDYAAIAVAAMNEEMVK